jgi:hypothetical protein
MNESTTKTLPNLRSIFVQGRMWHDKANGNSYHAVRIWANGKHLIDIGMTYGYEDMYLQTALEWLKSFGLVSNDTRHIYELRDTLDIYNCVSWGLKKELFTDSRKNKDSYHYELIRIEALKDGEF